jgi:hypothetical protein
VAGNSYQNENTFLQKKNRILLKDKYRKLSQNANTGDHTLIPKLGFFILEKQLASQNMFLVRSTVEVRLIPMYNSHAIQTFCYLVSLSCIVWIHNLTITIISQKYQELTAQLEIGEYS